ncbi:unnamed protein product, partial [Nesidiocoris tenuis]
MCPYSSSRRLSSISSRNCLRKWSRSLLRNPSRSRGFSRIRLSNWPNPSPKLSLRMTRKWSRVSTTTLMKMARKRRSTGRNVCAPIIFSFSFPSIGRSPDFKLPRRIRKRRQNARLKSLLAPKNALMVLHELHPELKMLVSEQVSNTNQMSYIVDIEIDGQSFRGIGMSKNAAKQAASESALKAVLLKKIEESNSGAAAAPIKSESADEEMPLADAAKSAEGESADGATNGDQPKTRAPPEDDVPWGSLASFALYKLFSEWQSQGFQLSSVTGLHHMTGVAKPPPAPTPMKKLPEDAHTKHPVQLLNQLYPGCLYHENREGAPPKMTFTFSVVVNDQTFKGVETHFSTILQHPRRASLLRAGLHEQVLEQMPILRAPHKRYLTCRLSRAPSLCLTSILRSLRFSGNSGA